MAVIYRSVLRQLLVANWWLSVWSVLCQLPEADWWLSAEVVQSIGYLMQVDLNSSVTCGRLVVVCMGCVNCVSYLRQVGGCLQSVYSFSYSRQVDGCLQWNI